MASRFLTLTDVTEILNISMPQAYALVHSGELRGMQIGGRGQWRVSETDLDDYVERMYAETQARIRAGEHATSGGAVPGRRA